MDAQCDIHSENDTWGEGEGFMMPTGMIVQREGKYLMITFENARQMTTLRASDAMWVKWAAEIGRRAENVQPLRERREPM